MKQMKKLIIITLAILMIGVFALSVFAHPGKTDEYGGHNDYANGDYHYHHGYDAHYHDENGNCPYDNNEQYYEETTKSYYEKLVEELESIQNEKTSNSLSYDDLEELQENREENMKDISPVPPGANIDEVSEKEKRRQAKREGALIGCIATAIPLGYAIYVHKKKW